MCHIASLINFNCMIFTKKSKHLYMRKGGKLTKLCTTKSNIGHTSTSYHLHWYTEPIQSKVFQWIKNHLGIVQNKKYIYYLKFHDFKPHLHLHFLGCLSPKVSLYLLGFHIRFLSLRLLLGCCCCHFFLLFQLSVLLSFLFVSLSLSFLFSLCFSFLFLFPFFFHNQ